jgi:hypothetical protein
MEIYVPFEFSICNERRGSEVHELFQLFKKQNRSNLLFQDSLVTFYAKFGDESENGFNEIHFQRLKHYTALDDLYIQVLIDFSLRAKSVFSRWPSRSVVDEKLYSLNLLTLIAKEVNLGVMRYLPNGVYSDIHNPLWSQLHELFVQGLNEPFSEIQLLERLVEIEDVCGGKPLRSNVVSIVTKTIGTTQNTKNTSMYDTLTTNSKMFALCFLWLMFEEILLEFTSDLEDMDFHQAKTLLRNNEYMARLHYDAFINKRVPA